MNWNRPAHKLHWFAKCWLYFGTVIGLMNTAVWWWAPDKAFGGMDSDVDFLVRGNSSTHRWWADAMSNMEAVRHLT